MTAISSLKLYVDENVLKQDTPYSYFYPVTDEVRHMDWYTRAASTKGNFWMSGLRTGPRRCSVLGTELLLPHPDSTDGFLCCSCDERVQ